MKRAESVYFETWKIGTVNILDFFYNDSAMNDEALAEEYELISMNY
jgi:hypothetical protein